jgi:hypothetical protein
MCRRRATIKLFKLSWCACGVQDTKREHRGVEGESLDVLEAPPPPPVPRETGP